VFNNEANEPGAAIDETEHHILGALGSGDFKSQGEAWVQAMHTDMNELVRLRSAVQSLDESRHTLMNEFTTTAVSLKASTRSLGQSAATVPTGSDTRQQTISQSSSSTHDAPTLTRRTTVPDRNPSAVVAWISGAVLLLLVVISLATVWSIVVPVRRMLHGTAQIANGNLSARLAPGGIKELHSLALSFNKMAEQLEIAQQVSRGHLQQLEARVEERTRQLRELALNDPLTSLPNRRHLFTMLEAALSDARLHGHHVGVLFLDIDNFKNINDSMGHAFGDRLLQGMARRLRETISADAFVSRLGGDEFTIVYPDVHDVHSIETAGWALVHAFQQSLAIDARELAVSVSVGASIYPTHGEDPDALLQAADTALFHAKSAGRRQLAVFSPELFEIAAKKFATEQGLRRALQRDEFELVFQPEFDVRTFEVSLVEALIRWRQADGRLAPPGEFLSIAEECGLITELNDWVLRAAIETAARWYHGPWPKARVAVNVSSRQLIDSNLVERIAMLLREYRVPASIIEIELTESVLQTGRGTLDALKQLRALGVSIALDDFGAGYSSLASLQELPLTRIKLDRSLIESIDTNARSLAIARTIITLCRSLGLDLTAEGIERQQQLVLLRAEGHLHVQGYYLARPMSKDHLLRALVELPRQFNNPAAECAPLHVAVS
jgi:diguanylate cyclase (GGDEF)-like protein